MIWLLVNGANEIEEYFEGVEKYESSQEIEDWGLEDNSGSFTYNSYPYNYDHYHDYDFYDFELPDKITYLDTMKVNNVDENLDKYHEAPWQVMIQGL